jgi:drug/metabolite transporter (DMT)-like permease
MMKNSQTKGILLAFLCLFILGTMPIITESRPADSRALIFAFFLSLWQLGFAAPIVVFEATQVNKGIFASTFSQRARRRLAVILVVTGIIFGLSTWAYVLGVQKVGPVGTAIALQAYPLFSILWEMLFLGRRKTRVELAFTILLLVIMYFLATGGTWKFAGVSAWFLLALCIPFLWSVAHVILKEVMDNSPITPAQITFFRVAVSTLLLGVLVFLNGDSDILIAGFQNMELQKIALVMGLVYYVELVTWFYAMRSISVSLASSITVPSPALTALLAVVILGQKVETYQIVGIVLVVASLYGLLAAGKAGRRP